MRRGFYLKLALQNMAKNKRTCLPYLFTCICSVMMYYFMSFLTLNPGMEQMPSGQNVQSIMRLGTGVITIFSLIFLFYTNSFLMKRRKKELGLYNILGMEKKHIGWVLFWETLVNAVISLILGLLLGILGSKLIFLFLLRLLDFPVTFGFFISVQSIRATVFLFGGIFLLSFFNNLWQISRADPVELLRGGNVGEKEPKTRWFLALAGISCLGGGYWIAVTTESVLAALPYFFVAVVLVMAGTYCLFVAVSVAVLKLLRSWKGFYYQTEHFTAISGMIYRMKQNAVGLANICILSTGVLLMISTTVCLFIGREAIVAGRYPREVSVAAHGIDEAAFERSQEIESQVLAQWDLKQENVVTCRSVQMIAWDQGDDLVGLTGDGDFLEKMEKIVGVAFIPLEDYNACMGEERTLEPGEVLFFTNKKGMDGRSELAIDGERWTVAEELDTFFTEKKVGSPMINTYYLVVDSVETLKRLTESDAVSEDIIYQKDYDLSGDPEVFEEAEEQLSQQLAPLAEDPAYIQVGGRERNRRSFYSTYGGLFFLGIFLGLLFLMATVLIIYYKQLSEGYEDRQRFEIMQKVGMSKREVRRSISSQILIVFFLPLVTAVVHIGFAFPLMRRLLALMNLYDTRLFAGCTLATIGCFALVYAAIYVLTARTYYRIVNERYY